MKTIIKLILGLTLILGGPTLARAENTGNSAQTQQLQEPGNIEEQDFLASYGVTPEILNTFLIVFGIGGIFGLVILAWNLSDRKPTEKE